mgnify:CR=1 FL=1
MNDQIGAKEAWEQLLAYDPAVWIGVFTAIVVSSIKINVFSCFLCCKRNTVGDGFTPLP